MVDLTCRRIFKPQFFYDAKITILDPDNGFSCLFLPVDKISGTEIIRRSTKQVYQFFINHDLGIAFKNPPRCSFPPYPLAFNL